MSDSETHKSPSGKTSAGADAYTTPPAMASERFGQYPAAGYQEVQNLPTPIGRNAARRVSTGGAQLYSPVSRLHTFPEEEEHTQIDMVPLPGTRGSSVLSADSAADLSTMSHQQLQQQSQHEPQHPSVPILKIPKTRRALAENNTAAAAPVRFVSEFKYSDPTSAQLESSNSQRYHQADERKEFIRPVDRLVSVPITSHSASMTPPESLPKPPLSEPSIKYAESPQDSFVTYSIGKPRTKQIWQILREIGHGAFSKVYLCDDRQTAIKVTNLRDMPNMDDNDTNLRMQNSITREMEILKELFPHPNIVHLLGYEFQYNIENSIDRVKMAINYAPGGDLYDLILSQRQNMNSDLIGSIFSQIVNAIHFIHTKHQIVHRDIKLENVLLLFESKEILECGSGYVRQGKPILMLSDFGLSKKLSSENELLSTRCGSEDYVSPELLLGMKYDGKQNDCWSLGVVLYTMLESRLPFDPLPFETVNTNSRKSKPSHRIAMIAWHWYYLKGEEVNEQGWGPPKEITKMLLTKRNKRADIQTIRDHPWVDQFLLKF